MITFGPIVLPWTLALRPRLVRRSSKPKAWLSIAFFTHLAPLSERRRVELRLPGPFPILVETTAQVLSVLPSPCNIWEQPAINRQSPLQHPRYNYPSPAIVCEPPMDFVSTALAMPSPFTHGATRIARLLEPFAGQFPTPWGCLEVESRQPHGHRARSRRLTRHPGCNAQEQPA